MEEVNALTIKFMVADVLRNVTQKFDSRKVLRATTLKKHAMLRFKVKFSFRTIRQVYRT